MSQPPEPELKPYTITYVGTFRISYDVQASNEMMAYTRADNSPWEEADEIESLEISDVTMVGYDEQNMRVECDVDAITIALEEAAMEEEGTAEARDDPSGE